jgi:hypothetical protein
MTRAPPASGFVRARSSAEEHYLDMVGVTGSIPVAPTKVSRKNLLFPKACRTEPLPRGA